MDRNFDDNKIWQDCLIISLKFGNAKGSMELFALLPVYIIIQTVIFLFFACLVQ